MGSGKSAVGVLVAARTGAKFYDLDVVIEDEVGMSIAKFFAERGEAAFREEEARLLPRVLEPGAVAALGGGAPHHGDNWRFIEERAVTVFLDCPFEVIWSRIGATTDRPLLTSRSRAELETLYQKRLPRYRRAAHHVGANRPPDVIAEEVARLWSG